MLALRAEVLKNAQKLQWSMDHATGSKPAFRSSDV